MTKIRGSRSARNISGTKETAFNFLGLRGLTKPTWIEYLFIGLFVFQCVMIIYINLFENRNHLGYDASSNFLKAIEIWRQGTLFPEFYEQSTLALDYSQTFAALFYGITCDIFLSMGISNILVTSATIAVFLSLLKELNNVSVLSVVLPVNLLLSPYLIYFVEPGNPIYDMFSLMYVSAAFYALRVLIGLVFIKIFLVLEKGNKLVPGHYILIAISSGAAFICGLSSGMFMMATYILPLFLFVVIKAAFDTGVKQIFNRSTAFTVALAGLVMLGRIVASKTLNFHPTDDKFLTTSENYFQNLQSIYLGFVELMGGIAAKNKIYLFSVVGIACLINSSICHTLIGTSIFTVCEIRKKKRALSDGLLISLCVIMVNLFLFTVCYVKTGSPTFENRYLIPVYISMLFIFSEFISAPPVLNKAFGKTIRAITLPILFCLLAFSNVNSQIVFSQNKMAGYNDSLPELIAKYDCGLIYGEGVYAGVAIRDLRVLDTDRVYKRIDIDPKEWKWNFHHWGDYKYYDVPGEYQGRTMLLMTEPDHNRLPGYIRKHYVFQEAVGVNNLNIYVAEKDRINLYSGLPSADNPHATNYAYTPGVKLSNGKIEDDGGFLTNGKDGVVLFGPYAKSQGGEYSFILSYEVLETGSADGVAGWFEIVTNHGANIMASAEINAGQTGVTLEGVSFGDSDDAFEHRVITTNNSVIRIQSIEMNKTR